jgi:Raf kinase inhibitor-like YbhB/YbcL family protein
MEAAMNHQSLVTCMPILAVAALASCGARDRHDQQAKGPTAVEHATVSKLALASDAFSEGKPIPVQYTCDGENLAPALHWSDPPSHTKSFALVIDDPDAPGGTFRHWGVYDIPPSARSIGGTQRVGTEVTNDFGKLGYGGPCPPKGHGPHHYHFRLFALNVDRLQVGASAKVADVERAATAHAIAEGELIGTYERR